MKKLSDLSIVELAAKICEDLKKEGLQVTLSGGACAEIYSHSKYVTGDLVYRFNKIVTINVAYIIFSSEPFLVDRRFLWPENVVVLHSI